VADFASTCIYLC